MVSTSFLYKSDIKLTSAQFIGILKKSGLAERRPVDEPERIEGMLENADILITAWDGDELIGVARAISDFSYCTYLSDIAVDKTYQSKGIGKELMRQCRKESGGDHPFFLFAAPAANDYYPHVGFDHYERTWILFPENEIK